MVPKEMETIQKGAQVPPMEKKVVPRAVLAPPAAKNTKSNNTPKRPIGHVLVILSKTVCAAY